MEHCTTKEERSLHKIARMNERFKRAYLKKHKVSEGVRIQLFQIPQSRQQQYRPESNKRQLDLVESAAKNKQQQIDKLHKSLGRITNFYKQVYRVVPYMKSTQSREQLKSSNSYKKISTRTMGQNSIPPQIFPLTQIVHRKFMNSHITSYFKQKPD